MSCSTTRGATRRSSRLCSASSPTAGRGPSSGSAPTRTGRATFATAARSANSPVSCRTCLKVLAAAQPLSLQTHPNAEQAREGHARGAFVDPNPKPELLCALTPFEAFCGVRPVDDTVTLLHELDLHAAGTDADGRRSRRRCRGSVSRVDRPATRDRRLCHERSQSRHAGCASCTPCTPTIRASR